MGVWPVLQEYLTSIKRVHVSDRGHFGGSMIDGHDHGVDAVGYVVENAWLGSVLLRQLRQSNVLCFAPANVTQIKPTVQGARLTVKSGNDTQQLCADLAVIADGVDSPLRDQLGIAVESTDYQQAAIIANVSFSKPHAGVAYERFTDEGPLAMLPLSDDNGLHRSALVWTHPIEKAENIMMLSDDEFMKLLQTRFGYRLGYIERVGKRECYPLQLVVAKEQVRSNIAVMGNAAHFLHPVAGQGFNLALRDCMALVETLVHAKIQGKSLGDLSVLNQYQNRQRQDQALTYWFE